MNHGNFLKKIFTIGDLSASASEAFVENWKYGWIEHIKLPVYPSNFKNQDEFFSLFVIDSDVASLSLIQSHMAQLKNSDDCELIVLAETPLTSEQLESLSKIDKSLKNSNVKVVSQSSLNSVLECYAHLLCGFSISCLDFRDMHEWLHAGTTFISAGTYIDEAVNKELPYRLYIQLADIKKKYEKLELEIAAINVVFLGDYICQDLFSASMVIIRGIFDRDLNLSAHSNIHDSHQDGKVGLRIFASLKKSENTKSLLSEYYELPAFLKT